MTSVLAVAILIAGGRAAFCRIEIQSHDASGEVQSAQGGDTPHTTMRISASRVPYPHEERMKSLRVSLATALLATTAFAFGADTAGAEESGSFRALLGLVSSTTTIDHHEGTVTAGSATGTVSIVQSSGGPFDEGTNSVVTCVGSAKTSAGSFDLQSFCTLTDTSGDSWFLRLKRDTGDREDGGGGQGRYDLLGGTGKFSGVTGSCPYDVERLPGNHLVMAAHCTWQK